MGNVGDPITPSIPVVGSAGPNFATDINAILGEVVSRLSNKIPLASLNTNTNLNLEGSALTNAGYITLTNIANPPSSSPVNRLTVFGGDLYYVSPSSVIQLTAGGLLNAAAIGGITGAYGGANPAQFRYDNIATRYDAYANFSTSTWGYVRALGFDIAAGATSALFARIQFAGAGSLTFTLPAALPASAAVMFLDNTGAITSTVNPSISGTLGVTGLITASSGLTASANQPITISGTANIRHGIKTISAPVIAANTITVSGSPSVALATPGASHQGAAVVCYPLPPIPQHDRVTSVVIHMGGTVTQSMTFELVVTNTNNDTSSSFVATGFSTSGITNTATISAVNTSFTAPLWVRITGTSTAFTVKTIDANFDCVA